jgi:Ca2+-binding RTX toxin-like protein
MAYDLKPFFINSTDLTFLLDQVNFRPLFDAQGNAVVQWDGSTAIYDAHNVLLSGGSPDPLVQSTLTTTYGHGFASVTDFAGIRDVSGLHNNLFATQQFWGAADQPFVRQVLADYSNYVTSAGANYAPNTSTIDGMPRIISRTITTGGVNMLVDSANHLVVWNRADFEGGQTLETAGLDAANYATWFSGLAAGAQAQVTYFKLISDSGVDLSQDSTPQHNYLTLVEGAKIVAPAGLSIDWDPASYNASAVFKAGLSFYATSQVIFGGGSDFKLYGTSTGGALTEGGGIFVHIGTNYVPVTIGGVAITFDANLYLYKNIIDASGVSTTGLPAGTPVTITTAEINAVAATVAPSASLDNSVIGALVATDSGYGLLETLGHIDFQNPTSGEFFIGQENPGVSPVNSWFATFGQFFDHGLDFIDKGGNGKIKISLSSTDPLYGALGPDGQPVTSITISRATNVGDVNDPSYIDHTSPFIDQSQTYGSSDQLTSILREWTKGIDDTYHAGIRLFDGQSLQDAWERRWPDGTVEQVHDTLPTLNELRDHINDTSRAALTWEDVTNLRNRDVATGQLSGGDSGHALLLDMNPRFDMAHLNPNDGKAGTNWDDMVSTKVNDALVAINGSFAGPMAGAILGFVADPKDGVMKLALTLASDLVVPAGPSTFTYPAGIPIFETAALIVGGLINPATFAITAGAAVHDAVGELLMAAVGDHYIAGDGRVNENFGLTSIHHVFHEEHNYQVENLQYYIAKHDALNPGDTDVHEELHKWQINTGSQDANGNYTYVYNDASGAHTGIAWDMDKFFNASKLMVEMEYQHAAVDQYARTITPRIQEFVGYTASVDPTISLEFSQVAFRFGHSTIRETIDVVDPSGWMQGAITRFALEKAFLNPGQFAETGIQAITLGLSRQQMNEVDEFITPALNQGLLGQPLDLAAINIARGRDLGIPTLNDFRAGIGLARYTSWDDFGHHMVHPDNLVNFIAAFSFGNLVGITIEESQAVAQFILDKAAGVAGAVAPVLGVANAALDALETALAVLDTAGAINFMRNAGAGVPAGLATFVGGFDQIDSWIGGLAEEHTPGSLLGETFEAVFVNTIQQLMDGDRFYYLYRLFGTNMNEEVGNGQFKDIVERNTGLSHLNGSIFAYADKYYDFNLQSGQTMVVDGADLTDHYYQAEVTANAAGNNGAGVGIYSDGGDTRSIDGTIVHIDDTSTNRDDSGVINGRDYIFDTRVNEHPDWVHPVEGTPADGADSVEVIVATDYGDYIHGRGGDDTIYGEKGNDIIYADGGVDRSYGGDGDDYIDTGNGPDLADGGAGKDQIWGRDSGTEVGGFDQLVGGSGNDLIVGGEGIDKLSGGAGDDIIYGDGIGNVNPDMANTDPFTHGGDGNDYLDGGMSGDLLYGDEGDDYIVGGGDQDFIQGDNGDDILRPSAPSQALAGGGAAEVLGGDGASDRGFDLIDFRDFPSGGSNGALGVEIELTAQLNPIVTIDPRSPVPLFIGIEGIIGSSNNDKLVGDANGDVSAGVSHGNNWLIGGTGSDVLMGAGGNDVLVGGSVRLDALIGKYTDAMTAQNAALGSMAWINQAMTTGGTAAGYGNDFESAATGASNRASGPIGAGLLGNATIGTEMFDKHFTEMLRSKMFKDVVLGDGGSDVAGSDTAVFTGSFSDYTVAAIQINNDGSLTTLTNVQAHALTSLNNVAFKVTDTRASNQVDANGVVISTDGTDIVIGVEAFQFSDMTINPLAFFDQAPTLDLNRVEAFAALATDGFTAPPSNNAYARGTGWSTGSNWTETGDPVANGNGNNLTNSGQIRVDTVGSGSATNPGLHILGGTAANGANYDGAMVSRGVDLTGLSAAQLSFDVRQSGISGAENVKVYVLDHAPTGSDAALYTIETGADTLATTHTVNLTGPFNANARVYFVASDMNATTDHVFIDNIAVSSTLVDSVAGNNNTVSYTEGGAAAAMTTSALIADPDVGDTNIASAKIVLTDKQLDDVLTVGSLPAGIVANTVTTGGKITVTLTGAASWADYQAALAAVTFSNAGQDPTNHGNNPARHIDVTVNDGWLDSVIATTTVNVTGVDNAATALAADNVITNMGTGNTANIAIPVWALVANDTDVDGAVINAISNASGLAISGGIGNNALGLNNGNVIVRDTSPAGGNFQYTSTGLAATATVTISQQTGNTLTGTDNAEIIVGNNSASIINALGGDDAILAGGGDDTVNAGLGNDRIEGQGGDDTIDAGDGDDVIVWNVGNGSDVIDGGANTGVNSVGDRLIINGNIDNELFQIISLTDPNNGGLVDNLLNQIGIVLDPASTILVTRTFGNNTQIAAELRGVEEITINTQVVGSGTTILGNDMVSIIGDFTDTGLALNTITVNGSAGNDTVDISRLTSAHRIVFNSTGGDDRVIGDLRAQDVVHITTADTTTPIVVYNQISGTENADRIRGTFGNDAITAKAGRDVAWGDDGNDKFVGQSSDGNDRYYGENGDDVFVAAANDGRDYYHGGSGIDTLDMSAINQNIIVNISGKVRGTATVNGVNDSLVSIENIKTGAGSDTVFASTSANVIDTGAGADHIVFKSATHADGDTIVSFDAGDVIDLSAMMKGSLTLVQGSATNGTGQIAWEFDATANVTELHGTDVMGNHFEIDIKGDHRLTSADFAA